MQLPFLVRAAFGVVATALASGAAAAVNTPVLKWAYGGCTGSPGNYACDTGWYSSPAVADLDGDGPVEVIWGANGLFVVRGTDGVLRASAPSGNRVWPGVAVADLTGNGTPELIVGRGGDELTVYAPSANAGVLTLNTLFTRNPFGGGEVRTLAVTDLDGDGPLEIVVGRASSGGTNQVNVFDAAGNVRAGWPARRTGEPGNGAGLYNENVTVADLYDIGLKQIIAPTDTHYITALDRNGNQLAANAFFNGASPAGPKVWSQVGVHVDLAADLRGYANCGTEHRPNFANSAPAVGDVDGDGTLEIVVPGDVYNCAIGDDIDGDLHHLPWILKADRMRWTGSGFDWTVIPTAEPGSGPLSEDYNLIENSVQDAVLADLDGDGRKEILFPSYDGRMHAWWLDKTEHGAWPVTVPASGALNDEFRFASEPVVADLDNDGQAEVIFTSWPKKTPGLRGELLIYSSQGVLLQRVTLPAPARYGDAWNGALGAPTLANIDGDADLEVVLGTRSSGIVAYDLPGTAGARVLWGTGRGNYRRTAAQTPGRFSIGDVSVSESAAVATFTVTLSRPADGTVSVAWATSGGSAIPGSDYMPGAGLLTFAPGTTSRTLDVSLLPDALDESDETFTVVLSAPAGATIADGFGQATIVDDDPAPALSVDDVSGLEGDADTTTQTFTVTLSGLSAATVGVNYATVGQTATLGSDFVSAAAALSWPPGTSGARTVAVAVLGDKLHEADETYALNLSGATNATLVDSQGIGTIQDDDAAGLTLDDVRIVEPKAGTRAAAFTVTLTPANPSQTVTVDWSTAPDTASAGSDYVSTGGTLSFAPGVTTRTATVTVNSDSTLETVERFFVNLSNASPNATIASGQGVGTIVDAQIGGDFDGDGDPDILWRHRISGRNVVWLMNGSARQQGLFTTPDARADTNWRIVGTADFNANGRSDILWRNVATGALDIWLMNGTTQVGPLLPLAPGSEPVLVWNVVGTGDFNADQRPDLFWRNGQDGSLRIWTMNGPVRTAELPTTPAAVTDLNWVVVGVGDFSGDGRPDILWRHQASGKNVVWTMNGAVRVSGVFTNPDTFTDLNWKMAGVGDYNNDGWPDIVWRHALSGRNVVWFMHGLVRVSGGFTTPDQLADSNWEIVGPK